MRQRDLKIPMHHTLFKFVILGFFVGKSHNMIGHGIFQGDLDFFYLHEKSLYLSYYEIFPQKILKSRTFKKCGTLITNLIAPRNVNIALQKFAPIYDPNLYYLFESEDNIVHTSYLHRYPILFVKVIWYILYVA